MDFSSFAEESFDLKGWINVALESAGKTEESVEQHASTLVMKLQLLSLELNNSLEEISVQALQSIPRAMREIERVRKEATDLKKKVDGFNVNLSKIEDNTVESLLLISELDKVKSRIEVVSNALREAEKLNKISEGIENVFSTSNFIKIAEELNLMQSSLSVLKDVPEFYTQQKHLEKLQDRLEGLTRPHLLHAFQERSVEKTLQFVDIFTKINRLHQLLQHYYRCRQVPLEQFWNSFDKKPSTAVATVPSAVPGSITAAPAVPPPFNPLNQKGQNLFIEWLPTFYEEVLMEVRTETTWSMQVFPRDIPLIPSLLVQTLSTIFPAFKKRIESYVLYENNMHPLEDMITLYGITQTFARTVNTLLAALSPEALETVISTIFEPYFSYQNDYHNLEKKGLLKNIQKLKPAKGIFSETITAINNAVPKLFILLESSIEHCIKFTNGIEGESLLKALSDVLLDFVQHLSFLLQHLREQAHLDIPVPVATINMESPAPHQFDWLYFQGSLQLLEIINNLITRLSNFDRLLRTNLLQQKSVLLTKTGTTEGFKTGQALHIKNNPDKAKKVGQFFQVLEDVSQRLLPAPSHLLVSFASAVHSMVFDTSFSYIKERLLNLPSLNIWTTEPERSTLNLPSFSPSPFGYITQIGDHLFTLPHQLEPFSSNESSLYFDPKSVTNLSTILDRDLNTEDDTFQIGSSEDKRREEKEQDEEENKFTLQWMNAIGSGTMALYVQKIMEIPSLSEHGAKQLATDISFLINVLSALGITIDSSLERIVTLLATPKDKYDVNVLEGSEQLGIIFAKKRGIKV